MQNAFRSSVLTAAAIAAAINGRSGSLRAADSAESPDTPPLVALHVSPAAEPVPALKYRLLPELRDQTKGNAALDYCRVGLAFTANSGHSNYVKFSQDKLDPWAEMPLEKLPQEEVARALAPYEYLFKELERAAHRNRCEWEVPVESDGVETRLTEFQELRQPARLMALRARLQMARGDLDGALASMAVNYQLARNLDKGRLIITSLIGVAVGSITGDQLETFIQQPAAPNLYWAITALPRPFIDCRAAIEAEGMFSDYAFPELATFRSRIVSREEARRLSDQLLERWLKLDSGPGHLKTLAEARTRFAAAALANYSVAKRTLVDSGRSKQDVDAMPVEQVMALASYLHWRIHFDAISKWISLPSQEGRAGVTRAERDLAQFYNDYPDRAFELTELLPAIGAVLNAMERRERQFAALRIVEAIRLYAHAHAGQLPESLDKIESVPVPVDPMTGQAFSYRAEGSTAYLETPRAFHNSQDKYHGRRYSIDIRK